MREKGGVASVNSSVDVYTAEEGGEVKEQTIRPIQG